MILGFLSFLACLFFQSRLTLAVPSAKYIPVREVDFCIVFSKKRYLFTGKIKAKTGKFGVF